MKKELSNKKVFSCLLNTVSEGAEVRLDGRLFHARGAVTWNERSSIVWSRARGMISRWREPEYRHCSASVSSVQRRSQARYGGAMLWWQHGFVQNWKVGGEAPAVAAHTLATFVIKTLMYVVHVHCPCLISGTLRPTSGGRLIGTDYCSRWWYDKTTSMTSTDCGGRLSQVTTTSRIPPGSWVGAMTRME